MAAILRRSLLNRKVKPVNANFFLEQLALFDTNAAQLAACSLTQFLPAVTRAPPFCKYLIVTWHFNFGRQGQVFCAPRGQCSSSSSRSWLSFIRPWPVSWVRIAVVFHFLQVALQLGRMCYSSSSSSSVVRASSHPVNCTWNKHAPKQCHAPWCVCLAREGSQQGGRFHREVISVQDTDTSYKSLCM